MAGLPLTALCGCRCRFAFGWPTACCCLRVRRCARGLAPAQSHATLMRLLHLALLRLPRCLRSLLAMVLQAARVSSLCHPLHGHLRCPDLCGSGYVAVMSIASAAASPCQRPCPCCRMLPLRPVRRSWGRGWTARAHAPPVGMFSLGGPAG